MDYSRLRAAALKEGEDEEAVTVDTRALIDKVLARYSGEWTTLRELIQNAADAQATMVTIRWETLPSTSVALPSMTSRSENLKHVLAHHTLRRLLVQNNGQPFTKTDWGRLKRIAEGNPDETKIGAFGVGFYSVFADCEEPFVSSGSEAMAFYWKGNALFTRKLVLPPEQASSDTAFVLDYRNTTTPLPNLLSVTQFLATSLTFVSLQKIEFWIDDYMVLSLQKKMSPSVDVSIPRDMITRTKEGIMDLVAVDRTSAQIDASFMSAIGWKPTAQSSTKPGDSYGVSDMPSIRSFFFRLTSSNSQVGLRGKAAKEEAAVQSTISEDITAVSRSTIFLRITTGTVRTHVSASFSAELERATKKPPPKTTKLSILTSSYDETLASEDSTSSGSASKAADVFASVLPSKKPGGRIFIGFPTTQTTGAGMHISAPSVIPTVEREAIDLNARWVQNWNIEMLSVAGVLIRLAFANEMADLDYKVKNTIDVKAKGSGRTAADIAKYVPEALHILKTYTFMDSTPSGHVARIIEESFWTAFRKPSIEVYSSRGVLSTSKVRVGSEDLAKFVNGIPIVLKEMKEDSFMKKLTDFGLIKEITFEDIQQELEAKALTKDQLIHFIRWAGKAASTGELDPASRSAVLGVAVATITEGEHSGEIIALGSITNYLNTKKIPASLPIPPTTMPSVFTNQVPVTHLQALGWEALEIVPWLRFLVESAPQRSDDENITKSAKFSVQVLTNLSKNWDNLKHLSTEMVISILQNVTVMPTKMGMMKPGESYFPSVKLFDDLPTLEGCQGLKEKFLVALGVRKVVDLNVIFTRLLNPTTGDRKWSFMELIKYLTSVRDDIPAADMKKLKEAQLCSAEAGPPGMEPTKGTDQMYKVSQLFEPKEDLRALGLPILQWPGPPGSYRPSSKEARFLQSLGLRPYPTVPELVEMMASHDKTLREKARAYFIANHHINNYVSFNIGATNKAILPLEGNEKQLVAPSSCYTNIDAAVLGFNILKKELHQHANKFGVVRDPPIQSCVDRLIAQPPLSRQAAITLFEYFTTRLGDMHETSLAKLRDASFVPVVRKRRAAEGFSDEKSTASTGNITLVRPTHVYLGSSPTYADIFDFVHFGTDANTFLFKCGARMEPTKLELARLACSEPAHLTTVLQSPEKYLNLLRSLAEDLPALKKDRDLYKQMRTQPWLYAYTDISSSKGMRKEAEAGDDDDDMPIRQYRLAAPKNIVIIDDYISYRLFKDSLLCAPEDEVLENFYLSLGSQTLGSLVEEDLRIGEHVNKQDGAVWLRKHVLERTKLFLYEFSKMRKDGIKHDARWLENNLRVEVVSFVALRRSLRGHLQSHRERRSAASAKVNGGYILYIAADSDKPDMYQVGQAVCHLILTRPSQQAYFFFEPFLKLDLLDLRARGYNVDRILRARAAEARIAEEERRKALEAEEARIRQKEAEWTRQGKAVEVSVSRERPRTPVDAPQSLPGMPGAFGPDSPEDAASLPPPSSADGRRPKGLLSQLSRRFGFDKDEESKEELENFLPEPQSPRPGSSGAKPTRPKSRGRGDDGRVTSPAVVKKNLLNAIRSTRAHDSAQVFNRPQTEEVKEQATYCDRKPEHNITLAAEAPRGMKVYLDNALATNSKQFFASNTAAISAFERLLGDVAGIYGVDLSAMQIYFDEKGPSIAFNTKGSIFCNLRFFNQLHYNRFKNAGVDARIEATVWWWVVVAHELAHNLVTTHDSNHSYYTESFIQEYFPKMMTKAAAWSQTSSNGPANFEIPVTTHARQQSSGSGLSLPPPPPYR